MVHSNNELHQSSYFRFERRGCPVTLTPGDPQLVIQVPDIINSSSSRTLASRHESNGIFQTATYRFGMESNSQL